MANPNLGEEKNTGQVTREATARMSRQTQEFAQAATDVGEGTLRAGTELLQRNAEVIQRFWEAGRNVASQLTDPSMNPFLRGLGSSDEQAKKVTHQSARNMEAVLGSGMVLTEELQNMSREWLEFAQSRFQQNLNSLNQLAACRTPQDAAAVQSELMRDSLQQLLQSTRRTAEISTRMADKATRKITQTLDRIREAA